MKKLILPVMLLACAIVYGQQSSAPKERIAQTSIKTSTQQEGSSSIESSSSTSMESGNGARTYSVNSKGEQIELTQDYYENRLTYLENLLVSIQLKTDAINADPEEKANALQNGWFDQMEVNKQRINNEILSVKQKLATY